MNLIDSRPLSVFQHSPKNDAVIQTIIKPVAFLVTPHITGVWFVSCHETFQFIKGEQKREILLISLTISPNNFQHWFATALENLPTEICMVNVSRWFCLPMGKTSNFPKSQIHDKLLKKILKTWAHTPKEKYWLKTIFPTTRSSQDPQQQKVNARTQPDAFVDARPYPYFLICKHFIPSLKTVTSLKMLTTNIGIVDNYRRKCWFFTKILSGPSALRSKYLLLFWLFLFGVTDQ